MAFFDSKNRLFDYFNKHSSEKKDELDRHKTRSPLLKAYTIETSADTDRETFIKELGSYVDLSELNGDIFELEDDNKREDNKPLGWLEPISDRYFILYSTQKVGYVQRKVEKMIKKSPLLDSLWIADSMYYSLFKYIKENYSNYRFTRMKMDFNNELKWKLDKKVEKQMSTELDEINEDLLTNETRHDLVLSERINVMDELIPQMRDMKLLSAARSISMLRIPGNSGGGFDIYYNGKATNRSKSFIDFRNNLKFIIKIYSYLNKLIEEKTWMKQKQYNFKSSGTHINGSPVIIDFKQELDIDTFNNFIIKVFEKRSSKFKLWGEPLRLTKRKYHVYGLDLHLWQEIFLELTPEVFVLVLPEGVCGNTVNRFITSIQHYLEPDFSVYIGNEEYEELIDESMREGLKL